VTVAFPISIRPYESTDAAIVYDSWLKSMADELEIGDPDERRRFVRAQKPAVDALIADGETLVATPRKDTTRVMGWICFKRPDILHFIFVKKDFRLGKIARQLILFSELPAKCRASHYTSWGFPRIERLFEELTHDPTLGAL
jgi:hypothetical protein